MQSSLLLGLLKRGLLTEVEDDEERLKHSKNAAATTGEWLVRDGRPHLSAALILAIDEDSDQRGLVFDYAKECLVEEWPVLRNVYPEGPNELIRAIVLQGVNDAVDADPDLAAAAWYVTRTVSDMQISAGRWDAVVADAVNNINRSVRERLAKEWGPTSPDTRPALPNPEVDDIESLEKISTEALHEDLEPYKSDLEECSVQVAEVLGQHVPSILDALVAAIDRNGDFRALLVQQARIVEASRLREVLLWWRLAGWSELLRERYKQVEDSAECVLAAACDIHRLCPAVAPETVEHLLADVVSDCVQSDAQISFDELAEAWKKLSSSLGLAGATGPLIGALDSGEQEALPPTMKRDLTPVEAAVVAFRDFQTTRLTAAVPDAESSS